VEVSVGAPAARADFGDFYRGEFPQVYRAAFLVTGDREAALDLTQDAFERAYARWRRLSREEWAGGWVMTTALNLAKRRFRAARDAPGDVVAIAPEAAGPERVDLVQALRTLPLRQRQALVLHYVADLDTISIAQVMAISEGTVKAHLAQGRAALRRKLEVGDE
jgi:RNA polymerase sigma-70 factor (ECF subfamily)